MDDVADFHGAKVALLLGDHILTYLRDDKPGLPFAAHWDFPGGGREGTETPEECVLRELFEEFGLTLSPDRLIYRRARQWSHKPNITLWFFGGLLTEQDIAAIRFGDEGQEWQMMPIAAFLLHDRAVPDLKVSLQAWLDRGRV
ncbi:MAG: NUDIX hydrolase [Paracoccaceae bacterium]